MDFGFGTVYTLLEWEIKMFKQLKAVGTIYENYMIKRGRVEARRILLAQDEKTLHDIGISRDELLGGVKNWPWDGTATSRAQDKQRGVTQLKAIRQLRSFSDRELQDLGINRGMITDAVINGRFNHDNKQPPKKPSGKDTKREVA